MKQSIGKSIAGLAVLVSCLCVAAAAQAQDKIEIETGEVRSWLEQNWIWVAAGAVLLILIIALSRGSRDRAFHGTKRTTTVIKDEGGQTRSVTTTEEKIG